MGVVGLVVVAMAAVVTAAATAVVAMVMVAPVVAMERRLSLVAYNSKRQQSVSEYTRRDVR